jgi:hypothetical protein
MRTEYNNQTAEKWLDAALKQYGEAEPRPGLENRVLANLHAERARLTLSPRWWRLAAAAVTIAILAGGALLLSRRPEVTGATISNRPSLALGNSEMERPVASAVRPHVALKQPVRWQPESRSAHTSSVPRLEQFPAPAPLSEQEEMLSRYVRERRQEAILVARARADLLKQELEQFMQQPPSEQPKDFE